MADLVEIRDYDLDEEALQIGVETYLDFKQLEEYQGEEKKEILSEMNSWVKEQGTGKDTVVAYIEKLRKLTEDSATFSLEKELATLEGTAKEEPENLTEDLNNLYDGEGTLSDRVDAFRRSQDVSPATVGLLLATFDSERYPLYSDVDFRTFTLYFTGLNRPNLEGMTVGGRYQLFQEYCSTITEVLNEEMTDATFVDSQDFISSVVQYPECRYNFVLRYMFRYSKRMGRFETNTSEFIDEIRELPQTFLREWADEYEGRHKIGKIRYDILDAILDEKEVDITEIAERENEKYETNITQAWDDFKILAQIYYNYSKSRINVYLEDLADYLMSQIDGDQLSSRIITYQGATNIPATRSWMVLYPSIFDNHRPAYQLYLNFPPNKIEFKLGNGSEVPSRKSDETETFESEEEISVQKIVEAYKEREDKFWEWNNELTGEDPETEDYDQMGWFDEVAQHLRRKGQVIFHGAVGTGKTYGALNFSKWWIDRQLGDEESLKDAFEDRVRMITFHPTFSYEDFIQGITAKTKDGNLVYEPESGVFKEMCEEAKKAYEEAESTADVPRYILIIDEINRGNIPKIFGDTITLIEDDKRLNGDNEMKNELPHSDEQLVVPPNLYIIGTMNTADRSISLVDSAIRRRFRFKSFPPDYEILYDELGFDGEQDVKAKASIEEGQDLGALSILALKEVNRKIRDSGDLGKGKQIGHSYLIDGTTDELLVESWKNEVLPLLEEYYFGDMDKLREHIFDGKGKKLFDWEEQQIAEFDSENLRDALSELVEVEGEEE